MKRQMLPAVLVSALLAGVACAQQAPAPRPQMEAEKKAVTYLLSVQDKDGAWLPQVGPAVTAMVVRGLVEGGTSADDAAVKKALAFIEKCKQPDGGYYATSNPNYNSAIVLSTLAAVAEQIKATRKDPAAPPPAPYGQEIAGLQKFLKGMQLDESMDDVTGKPLALASAGGSGKPVVKTNSWYGGSGYGGDGRPDLSNTSYYIEALHDSGVRGDDPAMQKALIFVTRAQMNGATNDQAFAKGADDGGFIYTPATGGDSKFGDIDSLDGSSKLRSYGSMTYAGFKSLLYAGLTEDDPRVKAAVKWISGNWTLEYNPGTGGTADGQYYYLHAFSRAMQAYKHDEIADTKGVKHDWRKELSEFLAAQQQKDGSFVNAKSERWLEGNPVLATSYAVLALAAARK